MKLTFATKVEAILALATIEVDPPRKLWVYQEGSHHVYGGRPWDYCKGTERYFITDRYLDGNDVTKRVPGEEFKITPSRITLTQAEWKAIELTKELT